MARENKSETRLLIDRIFEDNKVLKYDLIEKLTEAKKEIDKQLEYLVNGAKYGYVTLENHEPETPFETKWENWIQITYGIGPIAYKIKDWHPTKTQSVQEDYELIIKFPPMTLKEGKHIGYPRKYIGWG